jgi:hypothetical protein
VNYSYESCDIRPWAEEYSTRLQEAVEEGVRANAPVVVNLSVSHPRGFFPNQIINRLKYKKLLHPEVPYISGAFLPPPPMNLPDMTIRGCKDLETCKMGPWIKEIEKRDEEAKREAQAKTALDGQRHIPISDLTGHHPRGGIPAIILKRIELRNDPRWRIAIEEKIRELNGEANQCDARSLNMKSRAEIQVSKGNSPEALLAASKEQMEKAAALREQAADLKSDLDATYS